MGKSTATGSVRGGKPAMAKGNNKAIVVPKKNIVMGSGLSTRAPKGGRQVAQGKVSPQGNVVGSIRASKLGRGAKIPMAGKPTIKHALSK